MDRNDRLQQQNNRLESIADDKAISAEYVKALIEAQTGKSVRSITAKQVFAASADYTLDNKCFYAINLTIFP